MIILVRLPITWFVRTLPVDSILRESRFASVNNAQSFVVYLEIVSLLPESEMSTREGQTTRRDDAAMMYVLSLMTTRVLLPTAMRFEARERSGREV